MTEITQADRKAAKPYAELLVISEPVETLAQSFARHREKAEQETVAKIVAWLRNRKEMAERYIDYIETAQAADAIEAGEWK